MVRTARIRCWLSSRCCRKHRIGRKKQALLEDHLLGRRWNLLRCSYLQVRAELIRRFFELSLNRPTRRALLPESRVWQKAKEEERMSGTVLSTSEKSRIFFRELRAMLRTHWMRAIWAVLFMAGESSTFLPKYRGGMLTFWVRLGMNFFSYENAVSFPFSAPSNALLTVTEVKTSPRLFGKQRKDSPPRWPLERPSTPTWERLWEAFGTVTAGTSRFRYTVVDFSAHISC